ncbi:hypothetical protein ACVPOS_13925 [Staphylococcus aureus]
MDEERVVMEQMVSMKRAEVLRHH